MENNPKTNVNLDYINKFFLNKTNIKNIINNCFILNEQGEKKIEKKIEKIVKTEKIINENDKLFWFWYVIMFGIENYEMLGKNTYKTEMKFKTELVEDIHKHKKELKKFKCKLNDIEQNLVYSKEITIQTLMIILFINSINLVYFTDVVYYENDNNFNKTLIIYHDKTNNIFEMKTDVNIEELKNDKYIINSLDKQIKSISSYKVPELKCICDKLKIKYMKTANKSYTKKEIYEKIVQKIS